MEGGEKSELHKLQQLKDERGELSAPDEARYKQLKRLSAIPPLPAAPVRHPIIPISLSATQQPVPLRVLAVK
ncbi:hypothetical protein PAPYR_13533 [Paratrimastix pyriformis]|uniref:Uncharacterized protein n=1 Tax=Paratrimastix pyriformis TaxID=342808 RepID=A0ABQ8U068_9EUKA|nr:hypothetical protein PAPYR_13533 [Paratrimastix pyriformis]